MKNRSNLAGSRIGCRTAAQHTKEAILHRRPNAGRPPMQRNGSGLLSSYSRLYILLLMLLCAPFLIPAGARAAAGQRTVFVAAGHQKKGISSTERYAPGSSAKKAKLTSGCWGVKTRIPEYKTNLAIAKAARRELVKRGYKVIMLRTTNNCPLSNQQRTKLANKSGADIHICLHCDDAGSRSAGPHICVPENAKYVGSKVYKKTIRLANLVLSHAAKAVNKKKGVKIASNYYTTINWAKIPTFILECGYLSNPKEDKQLNSAAYQNKLAKGIANGVDAYFK